MQRGTEGGDRRRLSGKGVTGKREENSDEGQGRAESRGLVLYGSETGSY